MNERSSSNIDIFDLEKSIKEINGFGIYDEESDIDGLINDLEKSINEVNDIFGDIRYGDLNTIDRIGDFITNFNTNFKRDLIEKKESIIELLTIMNKSFALESTWQFKLKNVFDFVKEIFFGIAGINMWLSSFEAVKQKDIYYLIITVFMALVNPAVFIGFALSIIYSSIPVIVITSILALLYSVIIFKSAYDKIYVYERYERNKPIEEIERRNEVRNKYQAEITNFRSLCQKYIKEYDPSKYKKSEPVNNEQNLDTKENKNKNKDDIIKDVDGQNSKRQENQEDDTNRPKLSSLHGNTMSTQIHESSKQNDELG